MNLSDLTGDDERIQVVSDLFASSSMFEIDNNIGNLKNGRTVGFDQNQSRVNLLKYNLASIYAISIVSIVFPL